MNRRNFLKFSSTLSFINLGGLYLPIKVLADYAQKTDHFFVLVQVTGGWDVTLSLDPLVHNNGLTQEDVFLEYTDSEILRNGNTKMFAPAANALQKHIQDIHVIRGVEMRRDAGHQTNLEMMSSGYGDGTSALYPVELAATNQEGPMGVLIDNSILSGARTGILTNISSLDQNGGQASDYLNSMYIDDDSLFNQTKQALFGGNDKIAEIQKIKEELMSQGLNNPSFSSVVAAFKARASFQASLSLMNAFLDTHSSHEGSHLAAQRDIWEQVSTLFDYFKNVEYSDGESLFDRTTFLVVSEFSRTPALNASAGKDHNPHANAALLAGRGVRGGLASGESQIIKKSKSKIGIAEHISRPINFKTGEVIKDSGQVDKDVGLIFPENISSTIGQIFGNPGGFYGNKTPAKVIQNILKT